MLPGFTTRGPVVGEAEVAAFEGRCGFPLPADYRGFLLNQNGGCVAQSEPDEDEDEEDEDEESLDVVQFFSLGSAAALTIPPMEVAQNPEAWPTEFELLSNDLDWVMVNCRDAGTRSYPRELLPVAELFLGVLLLRLTGRGTGAVVHCFDPDGYEPGHVRKVASSFAELLRYLAENELA